MIDKSLNLTGEKDITGNIRDPINNRTGQRITNDFLFMDIYTPFL